MGDSISFFFNIGLYSFKLVDTFSINLEKNINSSMLDALLEYYGIAMAFNFSQHFLSPKIVIHNSVLTQDDQLFWQKYYDHYSMELFYTQKIDIQDLPKVVLLPSKNTIHNKGENQINNTNNRVLLGVGGGKDAIYAFEMLNRSSVSTDIMFTYNNPEELTLRQNVCDEMVKQHPCEIYTIHTSRDLPPEIQSLLDYDKQNHIKPSAPAASVNAIRMAIIAQTTGHNYLTTANEKSADFINTYYQGKTVNHQYGKSLEFEQDLDKRLSIMSKGKIKYFSCLKPLYEIRIAQGFSKLKAYFPLFNSCNRNPSKWCLQCAKCAFIYSIMAAFISPTDLLKIFGENLFNKESLIQDFEALIAITKIKPLECVGTKEEMWLALYLAQKQGHSGYIITQFMSQILPNIKIENLNYLLQIHDSRSENNIPHNILVKLKW